MIFQLAGWPVQDWDYGIIGGIAGLTNWFLGAAGWVPGWWI